MHKLIKVAIAETLKPYIEAKDKQRELMEAYKLRMNQLKMMIEDHRKELDNFKKRVTAVENGSGGSGGSEGLLNIKIDIDYLNKMVASFQSTNSNTF